MESNIEFLWYYLPGSIVLIPFLIESPTLIKDTGIILLPPLLGFLCHMIYRLFYYECYENNRSIIKLFHKLIKQKVTGVPIKPSKLANLYSYHFYTNPKYSEYFNYIRRRSANISGLYTILISITLNIILMFFLNGLNHYSLWVLYYFFWSLLFVFSWFYLAYEKRIMDSREEKILINNFNRELYKIIPELRMKSS